ncbi:MAG: chorismate mutase [Athalassotoga sp.]|uniref:chorismate mutase n=1 Tax=Athalassotoga sp. TaxID=2022597 RepID=UPI003CFBEDCA
MKAIRGAIFVNEDSPHEIEKSTIQLMDKIYEVNGITDKDVISVIFSITDGINTLNPATVFRKSGHDLPLMCLQEAKIDGAYDMVIRVMLFVEKEDVKHVYENGAEILRDDSK